MADQAGEEVRMVPAALRHRDFRLFWGGVVLSAIGSQFTTVAMAWQKLGRLPHDAPPYQMGSLKREELIATNSMLLHEGYFGNLGGDGKASGTVVDLISVEYGTFDMWEHDFRLTGMSLGGGSGWVILYYNPRDNAVHNYWAWDHTHSLAWGVPLLVMDLYEHAYHMDYGTNTGGYVDAFFRNIQWDEVNRRAEGAHPRS